MIEPEYRGGQYTFVEVIWTNPDTRDQIKALIYRHPDTELDRWMLSVQDRQISLVPTTWKFIIDKLKVIIRYASLNPIYHFGEQRNWVWDVDPFGSRWRCYNDLISFNSIPDRRHSDESKYLIVSGHYDRKHEWSIAYRSDGTTSISILLSSDWRSTSYQIGDFRFEHGRLVGSNEDWVIALSDYKVDPILRDLNIHDLMVEVKRVNTMKIDLQCKEIEPSTLILKLSSP